MKKLFAILLLVVSFSLPAQNKDFSSSLRVATGTSFLPSGNALSFTVHGEYDFYHNLKHSSSISMGLGTSMIGLNEMTYYFQGNINTFFSLFKRKGLNDFRIGSGITFYRVHDSILTYQLIEDGVIIDSDYEFLVTKSFGLSLIFEKTWQLSETALLAVSLYTQPYFNSGFVSGIALKFGIGR